MNTLFTKADPTSDNEIKFKAMMHIIKNKHMLCQKYTRAPNANKSTRIAHHSFIAHKNHINNPQVMDFAKVNHNT